jgi:hypothetical protein
VKLTIALLSLLSLFLACALWLVITNSSMHEDALFKLATELCLELEQSDFSKRTACFDRVVQASITSNPK